MVKMGFLTSSAVATATPEELEYDRALADHCMVFLREMLASRILFGNAAEMAFPWCAAGLITKEPAYLLKQLAKMKKWWEAFQRLEVESQTDPDAKAFMRQLVFHFGHGLSPYWSNLQNAISNLS